MMPIHPRAETPLLQKSLQKGASVARHIGIDCALAPLREEGVAILGSGMSHHNLREFFSDDEAPRASAKEPPPAGGLRHSHIVVCGGRGTLIPSPA
ncbi:hypothetical protein [Methylocystis bryophila]|uniref:Extradiol ring-cleavage dioxygenase class III enzyme subunit B domain-containing protein n=1 Tax=Methylocystis bryophila TaxID=655015 RepID=A0A1W6MRF0_9HYPH|nr:hypothetical protein [Methylocystis bryophila]ARN80180.1 hypothetical protein B1812_02745 [Methylocystis bryophila]BDV40126.1 hypothetical protein DSM21852_33790 [Methylocystis bryophila]